MFATRFIASAVAGFALAGSALGQADVPAIPPQPTVAPTAQPAPPTATTVLTAPPGATVSYPPGTVHSPACGPDGQCCGPLGANGPLTYELYFRTGPSLVIGGSEFSGRLNTGWQVGGGSRTLFFNTTRDAAWVLDTGVSYTYNRGRQERGGPLNVHTPPINAGAADGITPNLVRGLHRTSFNFALGRDWWMSGPGTVGSENAANTRWGADVGGRWGTAHVDLVPTANQNNYLRKRGIFHSVVLGTHADWERPMGGWIFFAGVRSELDYTFLNVVPPNGSDVVSLNFLFQTGFRY